MQQACTADERGSFLPGDEETADVVQDVDASQQGEFAPAAATVEPAESTLHMCRRRSEATALDDAVRATPHRLQASSQQLHQRERPVGPWREQIVLPMSRRQHLGETEILVGEVVTSFEVLTVHLPPHVLEVLS